MVMLRHTFPLPFNLGVRSLLPQLQWARFKLSTISQLDEGIQAAGGEEDPGRMLWSFECEMNYQWRGYLQKWHSWSLIAEYTSHL
jgi:hypothetical protein